MPDIWTWLIAVVVVVIIGRAFWLWFKNRGRDDDFMA